MEKKKAGEEEEEGASPPVHVFLSRVGGEAFSSLCKEGLYVQEGFSGSSGLLRRRLEPLVRLKRKRKRNEIK